MPGQDNSVCSGDTSEAEMSAEIRDDAAADYGTWTVDGRDRIPVRLVRHGGGGGSYWRGGRPPSPSLPPRGGWGHADCFPPPGGLSFARPPQPAARPAPPRRDLGPRWR